MALKFGEAQGSAKKSSIDQYTYKDCLLYTSDAADE